MITPKDIKFISKLHNNLIEHRNINLLHYKGNWIVGAMIVQKNKIAIGFNNYRKTHTLTFQNQPDYTIPIHAEISALNKWNRKWTIDSNTVTMYVMGLTKSNSFCYSSQPCDSCTKRIQQVGIKRIVYTSSLDNQNLIINELFV
jgi:tRNA(Arg) A34 adenosine deaminase TadA